MNKNLPFFLFFITWNTICGQITIDHFDMPIITKPKDLQYFTNTNITNPKRGDNQFYDLTNIPTTKPASFPYWAEVLPELIDLGIDVYRLRFKNFNPNFGYNYYEELDFNEQAIEDKVIYLDPAAYDLSSFTGSTKDSIIFPLQARILTNPRFVVKFPFTYGTTWSSDSRRIVDFKLKVAGLGLNNTPAQHIWHTIRKDSVIGYGKMKIYTPNGSSEAIDVLMDKISQYAVDSFFLNGNIAPPQLLSGFGVSQGQITNRENRINFYRKGSFLYLASFTYDNTSFSIPSEIYIDTSNLKIATSTNEVSEYNLTSIIYPNPCAKNTSLNIFLSGKNAPHISSFQIVDLQGRIIDQNTLISPLTNEVQIKLPLNLVEGSYLLILKDDKEKIILTEKIFIL